jgi:hypothetical protein
MPLTLLDGLQRSNANGADIRYLWVGSSTRVLLLHTMHTQLVAGPIVTRAETKWILRRVLADGTHDPRHLPAELVETVHRCGALPGHARAIRAARTATLTRSSHFSSLDRPREVALLIHELA